jgi:uncharacterized protein (TIGR03492 family)
MKLLCLSNGHGEDLIALRILQELQRRSIAADLAALAIVGEGRAYTSHGIPLVGPTQSMPSGGFVYMDGQQLWRDLRGGLLRLTWAQIQGVRSWAKSGGVILAVGDIVPLLFAWCSGAAYAFVGTAKSEYYLRDERGWLPRRSGFERLESWSGSVYLPWERWLMSHPRCRAVFPRDTLTTQVLQQWNIPAFDLGNPMMDGLAPRGIQFAGIPGETSGEADAKEAGQKPLTFVLLPGSRVPEAYENWQVILQVLAALVPVFQWRKLLFLAAIAPGLDLTKLQRLAESYSWRALSGQSPSAPSAALQFSYTELTQLHSRLILTQSAFNDCLHQADFAIAMAGTATEQFVGLGKPAITIPGRGPQFTPAFAEAQTRLLGPAITLIQEPVEIVGAVQALLQNPARLQLITENGPTRMGQPGAAARIVECLIEKLNY